MNPCFLLQKWLLLAMENKIVKADAMCLSTVSKEGISSSRMILASEILNTGITFFTDERSRKICELRNNPNASALFYWATLNRQIRIEGKVEELDESLAENDFQNKNKEQQLLISICEQSEQLNQNWLLKNKFKTQLQSLDKKIEIKKPFYWKGYLLRPTYLEFFNGKDRPNRRIVFFISENGDWKSKHIYP